MATHDSSFLCGKIEEQGERKNNRIKQLRLDTDIIHGDNDNCFHSLQTGTSGNFDECDDNHLAPSNDIACSVYRQEGISIGIDFLRMEGTTITRGVLQSTTLSMLEVIGEGAFSTVRRARWRRKRTVNSLAIDRLNNDRNKNDTDDDDDAVDVAVKVWSIIDSSHQRKQMLIQELRALCKVSLTCPALVHLYGAFLDSDSTITMVLEFMNRGSLEEFIVRQPPSRNEATTIGLSEETTSAILYQILCGLTILHKNRIVHRDLKPANVLLNNQGFVKLCDFGIASVLGDESNNRTVLGTTKFMSPERLRAQPYGRAADIWSLGCVIFQCLTRRYIWEDIHSIVDLLVTIEEASTSDILEKLHSFRYMDDGNERQSQALSAGLQEILVGCLQVNPGTVQCFRLLSFAGRYTMKL
jgi:serine/threonine protein kinase